MDLKLDLAYPPQYEWQKTLSHTRTDLKFSGCAATSFHPLETLSHDRMGLEV
jgi:hypothetical protein